MSPSIRKCSVLVVGAGPAGLFLAGELNRQGVDCRLIDRSGGPCGNARATAIQPRTLEILEQVGLANEFLAWGVPIRGMRIYAEGNRLISEQSMTGIESPFPFKLSLPQSRTERLLIDQLERYGQAVERNLELVSFEQDANGVRCALRSTGGVETTVDADYLIGCDGSHSTVRHRLGMHLEGIDDPAVFAVADVRIDGPLSRDEITLYCSPATGMLFGPLPEDRFIFFCDLPEGQSPPPPGSRPTVEELQIYLDQAGPGDLRMHDPTWLAYFHCHMRLAPHYQTGRVFLAGDAAHVQSPAAGQGLNTGIQDGFNLVWKLALVLRGAAPPSMLDSYHAERHHIGKEMLELTDQVHRRLYDHNPALTERVGKWAASVLAHYHMMHLPLRTTDETRISYHRSFIVREHQPQQGGSAWAAAPRAGDRAPDGQLLSYPEDRSIRLFELIREPRHHLIIWEGTQRQMARHALHDLAAAIVTSYSNLIKPRVILYGKAPESEVGGSWLDPNGDLHRRYGAVQPCLYLIRPDGYIGFRSPTVDREALLGYLEEIIVA